MRIPIHISIPWIILILSSCTGEEPVRIDETIYVSYQGAEMPAYVHGNPQNNTYLVVLHGAGSFGLSFRDGAFTSFLEEEFVVVYFDQRGQGMSQGHYSKTDDVVLTMAHDVYALIKVLKHKYGESNSYFLMGHSFGGAVGKLALLNNDLQSELKGWISVCGAHDFPQIAEHRKDLIIETADEQIYAGNSLPQWKEISNRVLELDPGNNKEYNEILKYAGEAMELLVRDGIVHGVRNSEKLRNTLFVNNPVTWQISHLFNKPVNRAIEDDFSLTGRLDEIKLPTLLLYGKYDMSVPYSIGISAFLSLGSPLKKFLLFENSMHHVYDTEPENFAEEVMLFIEDIL
jgi:pimeloyl-ACP methyl ester carboxylesterase